MLKFGLLILSFLGLVFTAQAELTTQKIGHPKRSKGLQPVPVVRNPDGSGIDDEGSVDDIFGPSQANVIGNCPECNGQTSPVAPGAGLMMKNIDETASVLIKAHFSSYSDSDIVKFMITSARDDLRLYPNRYVVNLRGHKKKTFCYRAVKDALRAAAMIPNNYNGTKYAYNGVKDLKAAGFKNLLDDHQFGLMLANRPILAPKGAVLVYETPKGSKANSAGHIEIKSEDSGIDGYISISESQKPTYGYAIPSQRRLIGVMIK
ncbi:MAG: hypothetical protein ACXVAX_06860 [Pseudobdellovibrio sp.]